MENRRFLNQGREILLWLADNDGIQKLHAEIIQEIPLVVKVLPSEDTVDAADTRMVKKRQFFAPDMSPDEISINLQNSTFWLTSPEVNADQLDEWLELQATDEKEAAKASIVEAKILRILETEKWEFQVRGSVEDRKYVRVDVKLRVSVHILDDPSKSQKDGQGVEMADLKKLYQHYPELTAFIGKENPAYRLMEKLARDVFLLKDEQNNETIRGKAGDQREKIRDINLSGSGLKFWTQANYAIGTILSFRVNLPQEGTIRLVGQVLRSTRERINEEFVNGIACHFSEIGDNERKKIIAMTFQKQREMLRQRKAEES